MSPVERDDNPTAFESEVRAGYDAATRYDLIEQAARVILDIKTAPVDPLIPIELILATALADAGMLTDPEAVSVEREKRLRIEGYRDSLVAYVARLEKRFPCDKSCVDEPEDDCSLHGRTPRDLWRHLLGVADERNALAQTVQRVRDLCDPTRGGLVLDHATRARILAVLDDGSER